MIDQISAIAAENGFSFIEVWLLSFFSVMWAMPMISVVVLSVVFGKCGMVAVKTAVTMISILPVGRGGIARYKLFVVVWSILSALSVREHSTRGISRVAKVIILVVTLVYLLPGYRSIRRTGSKKLHEVLHKAHQSGSAIRYGGVVVDVTWYPNFRFLQSEGEMLV